MSHALGEAVDDEPEGDVDGGLDEHGVALDSAAGEGVLHVVAVAAVAAYLLDGGLLGCVAYGGVGFEGLEFVVVADGAVVVGGEERVGLDGLGGLGGLDGLDGLGEVGVLDLGGVLDGVCVVYHSMFLLFVLLPKEGVKLLVLEWRCRRLMAPSSASGASSWPRMPFWKARVWSRPRCMSGSLRWLSS